MLGEFGIFLPQQNWQSDCYETFLKMEENLAPMLLTPPTTDIENEWFIWRKWFFFIHLKVSIYRKLRDGLQMFPMFLPFDVEAFTEEVSPKMILRSWRRRKWRQFYNWWVFRRKLKRTIGGTRWPNLSLSPPEGKSIFWRILSHSNRNKKPIVYYSQLK